MAMVLNKEIERIKSNLLNLSEDEFFEILKECGFGRIFPTEKIFEQLDVRKIVHAKWIENEFESLIPVEYDKYDNLIMHKYTNYKCSICGRREKNKEPYCNCGAKMDL